MVVISFVVHIIISSSSTVMEFYFSKSAKCTPDGFKRDNSDDVLVFKRAGKQDSVKRCAQQTNMITSIIMAMAFRTSILYEIVFS